MVLNFFKGYPSEELLPSQAIIDATTTLLTGTRDYDKGEYSATHV